MKYARGQGITSTRITRSDPLNSYRGPNSSFFFRGQPKKFSASDAPPH